MPSQYVDSINLPGNRIIDLRDTITELKDVNINTATLASGETLVYNGSSWVNGSAGASITVREWTVTQS